jgi:hypothetical protein
MRILKWVPILLIAIFMAGCAGSAVNKGPDSGTGLADVPRLAVSPDPAMFRALTVVRKFGKLIHRYMPYDQYKKSGSGNGSTFDPGIFCDRYELDLNEKDYWVTLTYYTAERAISRDPRIEKIMKDFSPKSIDVKLKTPSGKTFLLSDSNADGVLEFASQEGSPVKNPSRVDLQLLKRMQEKYRWVLGIVKRYYRL